LYSSEELLDRELGDVMAQENRRLGLVSLDAPLISNLSVLSNIALIKQYHGGLSVSEAEDIAIMRLKKLHLEGIAAKRNPVLLEEQRFCVMVLRAVMVEDSVVVIDRPFKIMPDLDDTRFIRDVLTSVDDMFQECHIFDYLWNEKRYTGGMIHDA
jgi:ABC-type transporter Mla maintaining outer membrane lipid asymmetry ATPase subunit MlaF